MVAHERFDGTDIAWLFGAGISAEVANSYDDEGVSKIIELVKKGIGPNKAK